MSEGLAKRLTGEGRVSDTNTDTNTFRVPGGGAVCVCVEADPRHLTIPRPWTLRSASDLGPVTGAKQLGPREL